MSWLTALPWVDVNATNRSSESTVIVVPGASCDSSALLKVANGRANVRKASGVAALLLPLPVLVLDPQVTGRVFVLSLAIPGVIHFVANLLEPKVVGDSLGLHPITIMMALVFWTMLWGPVGALLAAPMTAVIAILLERFEGSRPIAQLLAGQFSAMRRAL